MAEDRSNFEDTGTAEHVNHWLKSRAKEGKGASDLGQTDEEFPQEEVREKARELRTRLKDTLFAVPEFVHAAHLAYQIPKDSGDPYELPPVVFFKGDFMYYYLDMGMAPDINHAILKRKSTKDLATDPESMDRFFRTSAGETIWDDEVVIADYTGEGNDAGIAYKGHDDFQWRKTPNGTIKVPLTNTPYVINKIEGIFGDLTAPSRKAK